MRYMNILKSAEAAGTRAWLVGDTARMIVMGVQPDLMTLAVDTEDLSRIAPALGGTLDSRGVFPVLRGTLEGIPYRIFKLQGNTIEEDLERRDFSINAIAFRSDGGVVDPFNGRLDIRNSVIRLTGDDIELIHRDPLRILRMLRFAAELDMDIFWKSDADVRKFLESSGEELKKMPPERVGREILSGMKQRPWRFISLCDTYNLLPVFMKELDDLKGVPDQAGGTLFDHVLKTLGAIQRRLESHSRGEQDDSAVILAGLFSRAGTRSLDEPEMTPERERLISGYLSRWNIPSETIRDATAIIGSYRRFYTPRTEEEMCASVLAYGMAAVEAAIKFAVCIAEAEALPHAETLEDNQWALAQVLRRFDSVARQMNGTTRYLTGDEVMALLKLAPGKKVGELLKGLDMAVGTGKISGRAEAEAWIIAHGRDS